MLSEEYDALDERVSEIERSLSTAMEALTDLMSTPADEEAPEPGPSANGMLVRGFDPQAIAHPGARRQAWERLYAFVEQLNATWGALRSMNGMADYYVRARWWENPLTVSHLAALEAAFAEAYVSEDLPTVGTSLMLRVLEDTQRVLALVTGNPPAPWGQSATDKGAHWSRDVPSALGSGIDVEDEMHRRELFEAFLQATNGGENPVTAAFIASLLDAP